MGNKIIRFLFSFMMSAIFVITFLMALLYMAGRIPSWVEKGVKMIHEETGLAVELVGFSGNLWQDFTFKRLTLQLEGFALAAENGRIRWQPQKLWRKTIDVEALEAQKLTLSFAGGNKENAGLPDHIGVPFPIKAKANVQELVIESGEAPLIFKNVKLDYAYEDEAHQIAFLESQTPWGYLSSQKLSLGGNTPFKAKGDIHFSPSADIAVDGHLSGSLLDLLLKAEARFKNTTGQIDASLRLWEEEWLTIVTHLHDIDPKAWQASLPSGNFAAKATITAKKDIYAVHLEASNADPGPIDAGRWPLDGFRAKGQGSFDDFKIEELLAHVAQGEVRGTGQLGKITVLDLDLKEIDANTIFSSIWETAISGNAHLRIEDDIPSLKASLHDKGLNLLLSLTEKDGKTVADLELAKGRAKIQGQSTLSADNRLNFNAIFSNLDPALFGDYPKADLNGKVQGSGTLDPLVIHADIDIAKSLIEGYPFSLKGKGQYDLKHLRLDLAATIDDNRLRVYGGLGQPKDRLDFSFSMPKLAAVSPALGGQLNLDGHLSGDFKTPALSFLAKASNFRYGDIVIAAIDAKGQGSLQARSPLSLTIKASNLQKGDMKIATAHANLDGTLDHHRLDLQINDESVFANLQAAGGYDGKAWVGQIHTLGVAKLIELKLLAPTPLRFAKNELDLGPLTLKVGQGEMDFSVHQKNGTWESSGKIQSLGLADIKPLLPEDMDGDLRLSGQWQLHHTQQMTGQIQLTRIGGDLKAGPDAIALKLQKLEIKAEAKAAETTFNLYAKGQRLGLIDAELAFLGPLSFPLDIKTKVGGALALDMGEISWISVFLPRDIYLAGKVGGAVNVRGTLDKPDFYGAITGESLALTLASEGIFWPAGHLKTSWRNNEIHLDELSFEDPEKGKLRIQGQAVITNGLSFAGDIFLNHFKAIERPDRLIVASGKARIEGSQKALGAKGEITIDRADFDIAAPQGVTYASDVVVKGEQKLPEAPFPVSLALQLVLGEDVKISGGGVETKLSGQLNIAAKDDRMPEAYGQIHLVDGEYHAYGQQLIIDQGILNFVGPIENPALAIRAIRPHLTRTVGVQITGTANAPKVQLVSDPLLPDNETLSWLILGHGLSSATQGDASLLVGVASSLLGRGDAAKIQGALAGKLGLEEVDVKSGDTLEGTVVSLGKRLSSKLYAYYEQSIATAANVVRLRYDLNPRWSIETSTGDESAVDIFYNITFD